MLVGYYTFLKLPLKKEVLIQVMGNIQDTGTFHLTIFTRSGYIISY